jgi:cytochrome c55X
MTMKWLLFLLTTVCAVQTACAADSTLQGERRTEVIRLVREDCGSCHGLTLEGGLGPALLPVDLRGKDPEVLRLVIMEGLPGTPMPPWKPFLSNDESKWIVDQLMKGFPDEIR